MPTISQLVRKGRKDIVDKSKSPALASQATLLQNQAQNQNLNALSEPD